MNCYMQFAITHRSATEEAKVSDLLETWLADKIDKTVYFVCPSKGQNMYLNDLPEKSVGGAWLYNPD